jgi:hypothetical protein
MEKSRRGRRPKIQQISINKQECYNTNTPIIAHLPIDLSEVIDEEVDDIFIKSEYHSITNESELKTLKKKVEELNNKLAKYEKNTKPSIILCDGLSKCWWDNHNYDTPDVEMPENYINGIFNCTGKFCSWECMMAYNIDINDENVSKRISLIHMMHKKTYGHCRDIKPAPSWKILTDFGGCISIDEFRLNLTSNDIEYNYIKAPIISRISYIEKIPLKKDTDIDIKMDDLILKRSKPLKSSKYSLESIMGLKKIVNNN